MRMEFCYPNINIHEHLTAQYDNQTIAQNVNTSPWCFRPRSLIHILLASIEVKIIHINNFVLRILYSCCYYMGGWEGVKVYVRAMFLSVSYFPFSVIIENYLLFSVLEVNVFHVPWSCVALIHRSHLNYNKRGAEWGFTD